MNCRARELWPNCSSTPSNPPSRTCTAELAKYSVHLVDVLDLHGLGRLAVEHVGDGRGRPHRQPGKAAAALLPVVVELGEDARVVLVDRPGELLVAGDHLGLEGLDEVLVGPVGRVHRLLLGDDEARAAPGAGRQVVASAARWAARPRPGW